VIVDIRNHAISCAPATRVVTYNQMVTDTEIAEADVDRLFHALADATRRDIVSRTLATESSVSELAADYDMSFAAVQKHVAVLEKAGLVTKHSRGRERMVRGNPDAIRRAQILLDQFEEIWRGRIGRLDAMFAAESSLAKSPPHPAVPPTTASPKE